MKSHLAAPTRGLNILQQVLPRPGFHPRWLRAPGAEMMLLELRAGLSGSLLRLPARDSSTVQLSPPRPRQAPHTCRENQSWPGLQLGSDVKPRPTRPVLSWGTEGDSCVAVTRILLGMLFLTWLCSGQMATL